MRFVGLAAALLLVGSGVEGQVLDIRRPERRSTFLTSAGRRLPGEFTPEQVESLGLRREDTVRIADKLCNRRRALALVERGLLEVFSQGQAQATAQLVRLCVGEPHRLAVPLYLFVGASAPVAGGNQGSVGALNSILDPLGGNLNIRFADQYRLRLRGSPPEADSDITWVDWSWQVGGRYFRTDNQVPAGEPRPIFAADGQLGVYLQTGAWAADDPTHRGVFWSQLRLQGWYTARGTFAEVVGPVRSTVLIIGSADLGIDIPGVVNLRFSASQVLNPQGVSALERGLVKIGLDYQAGRR